MEAQSHSILVGTAGWSYKDWHGIVYPEPKGKPIKELDYLSRFFNTAEINSTFYRPANRSMAQAWLKKVDHNPRFKFTAKLWQRFTHDRRAFGRDEMRQYLDGIDPLTESGKLGAILCQFPWSFKNDDDGREWLVNVVMSFRAYPLVVEVRHESWDAPDTYDFLDKHGVGIASIDQPVIGRSIKPKAVLTGHIGYIRFHGRNYESWFPSKKQGAPSDEEKFARYNYLYSTEELEEWMAKIETVSKAANETFIMLNNHPRGQAVCNAFQIRNKLGEDRIHIPRQMITHFPQLESFAVPVDD